MEILQNTKAFLLAERRRQMKNYKRFVFSLFIFFSVFTTTLNVPAITYQYNDLRQLTEVIYDSGDKIIYTYDAMGNLINLTSIPAESKNQDTNTDTDSDSGQNSEPATKTISAQIFEYKGKYILFDINQVTASKTQNDRSSSLYGFYQVVTSQSTIKAFLVLNDKNSIPFYTDYNEAFRAYLNVIIDGTKTIEDAVAAAANVSSSSDELKGKFIYLPEKNSEGVYEISAQAGLYVDNDGIAKSINAN
jgi:hypothetical protein